MEYQVLLVQEVQKELKDRKEEVLSTLFITLMAQLLLNIQMAIAIQRQALLAQEEPMEQMELMELMALVLRGLLKMETELLQSILRTDQNLRLLT